MKRKPAEMQNLRLSLPSSLLRKIKKLALEKDKSVSALLRGLMEEAIRREESYDRAYKHWREDMKSIRDLGTHGRISWTRDELHERRRAASPRRSRP
ncbi:MAG TPA: CopG family transcriptional regulator [Thermoanaerobaculia bacterium]|nr:CopG family transcriptional regulator [Thermoanaerobaculia bacterium]